MGSRVATEDSRVAHGIHVPKILGLIPITIQQEKENGIDNKVHSFPAPCNQKQQSELFSVYKVSSYGQEREVCIFYVKYLYKC